MDLEESFLKDIADNPHDQSLWLILADWLQEQPEPLRQQRGEFVRLLHAIRHEPSAPEQPAREARLHELLAAGAGPCTPILVNSVGMRLALVPAGRFLMGSPRSEEGHCSDEGPRHEVHLTRPFWLGVHPISQREYQAITGSNPSVFSSTYKGSLEHPLDNVSWNDAVEFCERLSALPEEKAAGRVYRLPTEAEWEYACRAGTTTPFFFGPTMTSEQVNYNAQQPYGGSPKGLYRSRTVACGTFPPNAFGLCDLHGNVREWGADWYLGKPYTGRPRRDPKGPRTGKVRIQRGGGWADVGNLCRAAIRIGNPPAERSALYGFRVAVTAGSPARTRS
jgi:uncharacterized protein (TIGR02996 family)